MKVFLGHGSKTLMGAHVLSVKTTEITWTSASMFQTTQTASKEILTSVKAAQ